MPMESNSELQSDYSSENNPVLVKESLSDQEHCNLFVEKLEKISDPFLRIKEIEQFISNNQNAIYILWSTPHLPLLILENLTEAFYFINTNEFSKERKNAVISTLNVIVLMVSNRNAKKELLLAKIEYFVFPFLHLSVEENVKLAALDVFYSLYSVEDPNPEASSNIAVSSNIESEILPFTLQIIGNDSDNLKFRGCELLLLLLQGHGLEYAVQTIDRFLAIEVVLSPLISQGISQRNGPLLAVLVKIFLRLCDQPHAKAKIVEKYSEDIFNDQMKAICEYYLNNNEYSRLITTLKTDQ